jgi:hypothetical protein
MSAAAPYGVLAVFAEPEPLVAAAGEVTRRGYPIADALTPFPVPDLEKLLDARAGYLPWIVVAGGVLGALATYALILYSVTVDYPINVGGRPLNAWPPYLVLAFEGGILGAALAGFFGMLILNRLPAYYHPVFNAESFTFAKGDRFYLLMRPAPADDAEGLRAILAACGAIAVEAVEP